jgi:hypothetical protein
MPYLTLFTAPKPFTNPHIATIQRNALQCWKNLGDEVEVIVVGEESGLAEAAAALSIAHLSGVRRNAQGTPLVSSIFELARQASQSPLLAFLNADMLVLPDFIQAARQAAAQAARFLIVGQRWDLDITERLDFNPGWEASLRARARQDGRLHPPQGSDYFIFPRQIYQELPEFAIGRAGWDNWMIYHARSQGWPVIDGTPDLLVIHQNHDYSHLPGGKPHYTLEESDHNIALAGGPQNLYLVLDANRQLRGGIIRTPRPTRLRLLRTCERWFTPKDGSRQGWRWTVARQFRRQRRRLTAEAL